MQTAMVLKHANTTLWIVGVKKESEQWSTEEQVNKICQVMLMDESEKYFMYTYRYVNFVYVYECLCTAGTHIATNKHAIIL